MSNSLLILKVIAKVMRPSLNCVLGCYEAKGKKYLPRQHLGKLHEHKFKRNFQDSLNSDFEHNYAVRKN